VTGVGPDASVTDRIAIGGAPPVVFRRNVRSFFQGNRYLLSDLAGHVVEFVPPDSDLLDLYAGSGLFSLTAAAVRRARVTAVEGDRFAAADLKANASAHAGVAVHHQAVEEFLEARRATPDVVVVDPPRTGLSRAAIDGVLRLHAGRVIYVSCDPATLARDARRLVDSGYSIERVDAFDLFPNTPHVETVAVFASASA
jgi:23S rRNA (uracil1939-C5)-methyltransferase